MSARDWLDESPPSLAPRDTWPDAGRYAFHAHPDEPRSKVRPCADTEPSPPSSQHRDRVARVTVLPLPPLPVIEEDPQ